MQVQQFDKVGDKTAFKFKTMLLTPKDAWFETHHHKITFPWQYLPFCTKTHKTINLKNWQRKSKTQEIITMVKRNVNWMQIKKCGLLLHCSEQTWWDACHIKHQISL